MPNATNDKTRIVRISANKLPKANAQHLQKLRAKAVGEPDDESPEWTGEQVKQAYATRHESAARRRGTTQKRRITIMIDEDLLDYFQGQGEGYQTRINQALRSHIVAAGAASSDPQNLIESAILTLRSAEKALHKVGKLK